MTPDEAKAREELSNVHSPKLDALRTNVLKMRTSELLALVVNDESLDDQLNEDGPYDPKTGPMFKYTVKEMAVITAAALIAIFDEIDRRIPVLP
jgi:hypothetical protein